MVQHQTERESSPHADYLDARTGQQIRTEHQLEDLFKNDPYKGFAIQSAYITTAEHGVITVIRRKPLIGEAPHTYSIGFNTTNNDWPALRYTFDHDFLPGPLEVRNAAGRVANLEPYTVLPSALELLDAVTTAVRRDPKSLSHHIPASPNLIYCS